MEDNTSQSPIKFIEEKHTNPYSALAKGMAIGAASGLALAGFFAATTSLSSPHFSPDSPMYQSFQERFRELASDSLPISIAVGGLVALADTINKNNISFVERINEERNKLISDKRTLVNAR